MNTKSILIVDDEPDICQLLSITLRKMKFSTQSANTLELAQKYLQEQSFALCLTDMRLPDGNGLELVRYLQKHQPHLPVAIITAHGNMENAILAMKSGAFDFINKPIDLTMLRNLIKDALNINENTKHQPLHLIGESQCIIQLRQQIEKIARSQAPIYISGPSGSGKELVARLIHQNSPRRDKPFIPVNCGAIPIELMESEFFGHKKGSFTGAHRDKIGLFQAAHQGTLFLDEIADLPHPMQVKLLRGIQEKSFRPIGDTKEHNADVRFLCATHQDLSAMVENGQFRKDLFYRLNVIEIKVPSLKARIEDIPLLIEHILRKMLGDKASLPQISDIALQTLLNYSFPGNIRELENILERAFTLSDGKIIEENDLQLPTHPSLNPSHDFHTSLDTHLEKIEKEVIQNALKTAKGDKAYAAKLLGITLRTLRYRLKKLEFNNHESV